MTKSTQTRLQNDFGADLWVRQSTVQGRHATSGRGLFAGLQDVKQYNVENGFAARGEGHGTGLVGFLWSRIMGGSYRPPTN
ncbi:hypothetical protein P168DRAFT_324533 [Aspergillus campestris IBT 28561]|uniref:Uncharacterized protein n=1 Tax=Aspergillus campestris (strain IBT 28561) TaxID=1392248 RepID=A0A2I1DB38_ASPC2|nr:uncharacterized protein P168DRAFT_324533 [Aspergillus campestris IBT 28561]PKY07080.1 hypothetical protein P168DRAFT_324533 [Aspergillus campestris IBT 28561]